MKLNNRSSLTALVLGCAFGAPSLMADSALFDLAGLVNAGLGCMPGTVEATVEDVEGNTELLLTYSDFTASAGETQRTERKNCSVRIPTHVPSGMRLVLSLAQTDGSALISHSGSGNAAANIALSTQETPVVTRDLAGPIDSDFTIESPTSSVECDRSSDDTILGVTLVALVQERNRSIQSEVSLAQTRLVFHLEACNQAD